MIPLIKKRLPIHPGIEVLDINPAYLSVKLEKKITQKFNILVPYAGKPATGYIALEAKATPAAVELTGAASIIAGIETLQTKPLDLEGMTESFKKELPLDIDKSLMITASSPVITASVKILPQLVEKKIEHLPVKALNSSGEAEITPPHITIEVKGAYDALNSTDLESQISSYIDLEGLSPGVYVRNALIDIPVGLIMIHADPEIFTVKIK
jgi:YbbR domain-containing protein